MLTAAKAGLTIVVGGVLLGVLLGRAAEPKMKPPPDAPWRASIEQGYQDSSAYPPVEVAEVLIPFGGFPAESDTAVVAVWPEPDHDLDAELALESDISLDGTERYAADLAAGREAAAALPDAERAATAAESAVRDAVLAAARPPAQPATVTLSANRPEPGSAIR